MKKLIVLLAAVACATNAWATLITGNVTFSGSVTLDTGDPATANSVTAWSNTKVEDADGDFGLFLVTGNPVTFTAPWVFDPSTFRNPLWTVGGFTFVLDTSAIQAQFSAGGLSFLNVSGSGVVTGNGYEFTLGAWSFTTQSPAAGGKFSFSASGSAQGVPDSGATLILLGIALSAFSLMRRQMAA